jgi:hypothetical protein
MHERAKLCEGDWTSARFGASLFVLGVEPKALLGSCPAGCKPIAGLRQWRQATLSQPQKGSQYGQHQAQS